MIDYNNWKNKLYSAIESLSDISFQKEAWSGLNSELSSSFEEDIMILNDDNCFKEEFWNDTHLNNFNFSKKTIVQLRDYKTSLDIFLKDYYSKEIKPSYIEIINDPKWILLVNKAKEVLYNWDK